MDNNIRKPKHYLLSVNGEELEVKDILDSYIDEVSQPPAVSAWMFNVGKYYFRAFKKHRTPDIDLKKCIQGLVFILEKVLDKKLFLDIRDEEGDSILYGEDS